MCEKDNRLFYHLANQTTNAPKKGIVPLEKKSGGLIIASDTETQAKELHKHFNRKIGENDYSDAHKDYHKNIEALMCEDNIFRVSEKVEEDVNY